MSLADKWNKFNVKSQRDPAMLGMTPEEREQWAFYAGAEALWEDCGLDSAERQIYKAEIDHFRSHK